MSVNIYFHGRPQGQNIWMLKESADNAYLSSFLNNKIGSDVDDVMIIDIWKNNSYYTYMHRKNVLEAGKRPDAYMAVTVSFEGAYCRSVSVLFELLSEVYNKRILGKDMILEKDGEREVFKVSQLKDKDNVLKSVHGLIDTNIQHVLAPYIEEFKGKVQDTKDARALKYSVKDIDSPLFYNDMLKNRIVVSPSYKTKDEMHQDTLREVAPIKHENDDLKNNVSDLRQRLSSAKNENEALTQTKNDLNKTIQNLTTEVKTIESNVKSRYQKELDDTKNSLSNAISQLQTEKEKNKKLERSVNDLKQKVEDLEKKLNSSKKKPSGSNAPSAPSGLPAGPEHPLNKEHLNIVRLMAERFPILSRTNVKDSRSIVEKVSPWLSWVNTILLVAILVVALLGRHPKTQAEDTPQKTNETTQVEAKSDSLHSEKTSEADTQKEENDDNKTNEK